MNILYILSVYVKSATNMFPKSFPQFPVLPCEPSEPQTQVLTANIRTCMHVDLPQTERADAGRGAERGEAAETLWPAPKHREPHRGREGVDATSVHRARVLPRY